VKFEAVLQKGNRLQVPRLMRWQYKMEPAQVLKVTITPLGFYANKSFLAKMSPRGRVLVPKLFLDQWLEMDREGKGVVGRVFSVELEPAEGK
jgi:hypothetical protein